MNKLLCKGGAQRDTLAVSLCFASTVIMSLEALHPGSCQWMDLDADQSFALSAAFATVSAFLGTWILMNRVNKI